MVLMPGHLDTLRLALVGVAVCATLLVMALVTGGGTPHGDRVRTGGLGGRRSIGAVTWNIAAINDNPFEYWITYENAAYNEMMANVQHFIQTDGTCGAACGGTIEPTVADVFTPLMFEELMTAMRSVGWTGLEETRQVL
jgi:hypothetical protein